jgi:hypothetical protein
MSPGDGGESATLARDLAAALEKAKAGQAVAGCRQVAALLASHPADPRPYRTAFELLAAAVATPGALAGWEAAEKATVYRQLLLQDACPARPFVFHHGLASLLTSKNAETAAALVAEVLPVLRGLPEFKAEGSLPKPLVLFLLVARSLLGDAVPQGRITQLHLDAFPAFELADFELPYSVMFNRPVFGANQDDLLQHYSTRRPDAALGLRHLLLLTWLGAGELFVDQDNRDLVAALQERLGPDSTDEERAAARALILRYWKPGGALTSRVAEELRLGAEVLAAAEGMSRSSGPAKSGRRSPRLETRPWQAIQAARNTIARYAPIVNRSQRRVRIAVCISGQLRGYERAFPTWQRGLLAHVEHDLYVHTWAKIGRAGAQSFRAKLPFEGAAFCAEWRRIGMIEGADAMRQRYPSLFASLDTESYVSESDLASFYRARQVVVEDETDARFADFSNQHKMHYKIWAAQQLATQSGRAYDLIVRLRPDLSTGIVAFNWHELRAACHTERVLYSDRAFGLHYGQPLIGDQVAIAAPETMAIYAGTWERHAQLSGLGLMAFPESFEGHVSLAYTCWLHGIRVARVPLKLGSMLDPGLIPLSQVRAAIEADCADRGDATDRALLDAITQDQQAG